MPNLGWSCCLDRPRVAAYYAAWRPSSHVPGTPRLRLAACIGVACRDHQGLFGPPKRQQSQGQFVESLKDNSRFILLHLLACLRSVPLKGTLFSILTKVL